MQARFGAYLTIVAMIAIVAAFAPPPLASSAAAAASHGDTTKAAPKHGSKPVHCVTTHRRRRKPHAAAGAVGHPSKPRLCKRRSRPVKKLPASAPSSSVALVAVPTTPANPVSIIAAPPAEALQPPLPAAPANTAPPAISGSATEGRTLQASSGSWTESPTSYAYQWQDCDAAGQSCSDVAAATASRYALGAGDHGHTVRVVVTAGNAVGSTSASSAATAVVSAQPPSPLIGSSAIQAHGDTDSAGLAEAFENTASASGTVHSLYLYVNTGNTAPVIDVGLYSNVSEHAGTLLASGVVHSPTVGAWNAVEVSPVQVSSGTIYWLAALAPTGTLALRDVASGSAPSQNSASSSLKALPKSWSTGASWANSPASFYASTEMVEEPLPAPSNTSLPVISGSASEGQTLSTSTGTWVGSPTSYAYQWQDCDSTGGGCASVGGATGSSYILTAGDVGHTVRVVVTASNADGSTQASSAATAVVVGSPPAAPSNTASPVVSGSTVEGQSLSVTTGTWTGSPTSYGYQWQDCNSVGAGCANIAGASSASYKLTASDVGHTVRAIVTATNAGGSTPASSPATAVVTASSGACTTMVSPSTAASAIASDIVSATNGATICLANGNYPAIDVVGATHSAYVTIRPASGATATVAGIEVANSSFLRFEGLHMSEGFNMRDTSTSASHDYQFIENSFENDVYGIVLYGGSGPISKVLIEGNYMRNINFPGEACNKPTYAGGQAVTLFNAEGVTIAHNRFKEVSWHYIQGGGQGPEGVTVEHNLFEGPIQADRIACTHLNVWQIWTGGEGDVFRDNIVRGEPGHPAAITPILFETETSSGSCTGMMSDSTVSNNLFIDDAVAYSIQIMTTQGLTVTHNTVVGSSYGTIVYKEEACPAGTGYDVTNNIDVENGAGSDMSLGGCKGACTFEYNVSEDASAEWASETKHFLTGWTPSWITTSWNPNTEPTPPPGYYIPTGLPFAAGYEGAVGP